MSVANQRRPALRIEYTDPDRAGAYSNNTGSSFDVAFQDTAALLPSVLVSIDHMRTVLTNDVGVDAGIISNMTVNDMQYSILEFVRDGGIIDFTALFGLTATI